MAGAGLHYVDVSDTGTSNDTGAAEFEFSAGFRIPFDVLVLEGKALTVLGQTTILGASVGMGAFF